MTCNAILGRVILAVAAQARPHVVDHRALRRGSLSHIAVAAGTGNVGAKVRSVLKPHQRGGVERVNRLPGNFPFGGGIGSDLLDFWILGGNLCMAQHAFRDGRKDRAHPGVGADVTVKTLQPTVDVNFVRVRNRLVDGLHCSGRHGQDYNPRQPSFAIHPVPVFQSISLTSNGKPRGRMGQGFAYTATNCTDADSNLRYIHIQICC
jgi:hypothetical protein